jgi:hypothetical protein
VRPGPEADSGPSLARLVAVRRGVRVVEVGVWTVSDAGNPAALRLVIRRRIGEVPDVAALQGVLERATGDFEDTVYAAIGTPPVGVSWAQPEFWETPVLTGAAAVADAVQDPRVGYHQLLLGGSLPVAAVVAGARNEAPAAALAAVSAVPAAVASYLSGTGVLVGARCLVQVTGIIAGVGLGIPMLANARVRSLAHEALSQVVAQTLERAVPLSRAEGRDEPADDPDRVPEVAPPPDLTAGVRPELAPGPRGSLPKRTRRTARFDPPPDPPA